MTTVGWFPRLCRPCKGWHLLSYSTGRAQGGDEPITYPTRKAAETARRELEHDMTHVTPTREDRAIQAYRNRQT